MKVLRASVAPFLTLMTPFVGFVEYQRHGFTNPEVALFAVLIVGVALLLGAGSVLSTAFSVITLAALLTFVYDIQALDPGLKRLGLVFLGSCAVMWVLRQHAHRIVSLMMVTALALSWLSPGSQALTAEDRSLPRPASHAPADRPLVLHLLLDEFIGAEGLPTDLAPPNFKQELQSFFIDRGFRLFGKAYSEYPITAWSVPHLLNLAPGRYRDGLTTPGPSAGTFRLTRNAYFEWFAGRGYTVQVHEPDYLYLCPDGLRASCRTYPTRSLELLDRLDVPLEAKFSVVAGSFLGQSEAYTRGKEKYRSVRRRLAGKVPLPAWRWDRSTPASAGSMPMFDAVADNLSRAQPGTFVFAHILMPHYPYVYDAHCRQRPVNEWLSRSDSERGDVPGGIMNVPEGRAARYASYFQQVVCTQQKIDQLIQAIPQQLRHDAIIVIQGDHGSRITMVDPTTVARAPQAVSDFTDAFSTMFAVRSATIEPGYDLRMTPITCLLRALVESEFGSTARIDACSSPNTVYFLAGGKPPAPRPLPDFGAVTDGNVPRIATRPAGPRPPSLSTARPAAPASRIQPPS